MPRIDDRWQDKKVSERIHEVARDEGARNTALDNKTAQKHVEGLAQLRAQSKPVSDHVPAVRPAVQSNTPEPNTRTNARVVNTTAEQAFQTARTDARGLDQLASRNAQPTNVNNVETPRIINPPQGNPPPARPTPTNMPTQASSFVRPPQVHTPSETVSKNINPKLLPEQQRRGERTEGIVQRDNTAFSRPNTPLPVAVSEPRSDSIREDKEGDGRRTSNRSHQSATGGVYRSADGGALDRLHSGVSSDAGGEGHADTAEGAQVVVSEIPAEDTSLKIFNEFDSENPGIETVLAKRNILENHVIKSLVEKRIQEIAALDRELDGRIKNIFATEPLSERIIGDTFGGISFADFLKSVYGGLIG